MSNGDRDEIDETDETEEIARSYRRRRVIGTVVAVVIAGGSAWALWIYMLRRPSPAATCRSISELVAREASGEERQAQAALAGRVVLAVTKADNPDATVTSACEVYFRTLESQAFYAEDRYGWLARCLTTSWSAVGAQGCFDAVDMFEQPAWEAAQESLQVH